MSIIAYLIRKGEGSRSTNMTEIELYRKINDDLKIYFADKLSQAEALDKISEKWNVHKVFFPRLKIIVAVGYCILRRGGRI